MDSNCSHEIKGHLLLGGKAMINLLLMLLSRFSHVRLLATPIDGSPPGSAVHGIFQARVLEWVAIAFSASVTRLPDFPSCEILRFHNVFQALHFENMLHL